MENLPPFEGGESYMIPKNMDPAFGPGSPAVAVDAAALANQLPTSPASATDAPVSPQLILLQLLPMLHQLH